MRRYATQGEAELVVDWQRKKNPLVLRRRLAYFGFELGREQEAIEEFPDAIAAKARHALAESMAREEARHGAVKRNHDAIAMVRDIWRRSGGRTPRLNMADLTARYEAKLAGVNSLDAFLRRRSHARPERGGAGQERAKWMALPSVATIRDREVEIEYDVEEDAAGRMTGVARLRLPEKLARTLTEKEPPALDRPMRFIVTRGQRGAARAEHAGRITRGAGPAMDGA